MGIYNTLKELCAVSALSGREGRLCELIKNMIGDKVDELSVDTLGNLIALKKGSGEGKRIMLCAHMDGIGFLANFIDDKGRIRIATMGGVDLNAHAYSKVVSEGGTVGILVPEEDVKAGELKADRMYIDIGAKSRKEAERKVSIGDAFTSAPELYRLCSGRVAGKTIDNRAGCAVLVELAARLANVNTVDDIYYVFSVQEEVGCRGSKTATYSVAPHEAICIDVTRTGDTPGAKPMACELGGGAAIKIKDSSVICHEDMVKGLFAVAKENGIKVQSEVLTGGGTDTSSMQLTAGGAKAGALSVPTRHIHSGTELCDMGDIEACVELCQKYILSKDNK